MRTENQKVTTKEKLLILCLLGLMAAILFSQQKDFPQLSCPYLGQKTPGLIPKIFAPGLVRVGIGVHSNDDRLFIFNPDSQNTVDLDQFVKDMKLKAQVDLFTAQMVEKDEAGFVVVMVRDQTSGLMENLPFAAADGN